MVMCAAGIIPCGFDGHLPNNIGAWVTASSKTVTSLLIVERQ